MHLAQSNRTRPSAPRTTHQQQEELPTLSTSASSTSDGGSSSGSPGLESALDFTKVRFHSLRSLSLEGVPLAGLRLTADNLPALESLSVSHPPNPLAFFELSLPHLKRLSLEGVALAPPGPEGRGGDDFAVSLGQCPSLASFAGYRLMGLGGFHFLNLPQCTAFALLFSDDVKAVDVYGPMLAALDCQACPSLVRVHLHDAPLAGPDAVRAFRAEANRVDEARSGAGSLREEEAERDKEVDALVAQLQLQLQLQQQQLGSPKGAGAVVGWGPMEGKLLGPARAAVSAAVDGDESASSSSRSTSRSTSSSSMSGGCSSSSGSSGSDTEGDDEPTTAAASANPSKPAPASSGPALAINLLDTHLGALSLQRLAAHPRVAPGSLEGVTAQMGALGLSRLLRVESADLTLAADGATSCCSAGSAMAAGPGSSSNLGSRSPSLTPRSLASPCSSADSSGGFAMAMMGGGGGGVH